ncbi:MAG: hypothetical protein ACON4U_10750 [Myxococcota bacterium]
MSVNINAKKLTTLSQTTIKGLLEGGTNGWFLVEASKGAYFFLIDKKQTSAAKFRSPRIAKALLERYRIDAAKVTEKSEFLAGTVGLAEGNYELVIAIKRNGAGKSTLRSVMKETGFKKILKKATIVKTHSLSISEQPLTAEEAAEVEQEERDKDLLSTAGEALSLNDKEKNAFRTAIWVKDNWSKIYTAGTPSSAMEDFYQTCLRRLEKFKSQKLYRIFEPKYWKKKFQNVQNPLLDRLGTYRHTKHQNEILISVCQSQLERIQQEAENEDIEAIVSELYDTDFVEAFTGFNQTLADLGFSKTEIPEILSAFGPNNVDEFNELFTQCGSDRKALKSLLKSIGHNSWVRLLIALDQIEAV